MIPAQVEPLIGPDEALRLLGLARVEQLHELTRRRAKHRLPAYRIGRALRYKASEIARYVEACRVAEARS